MRTTITFAVSAASLIIGILLAATPAQADPTPPQNLDALASTVTLGQCDTAAQVLAIPIDLLSPEKVC